MISEVYADDVDLDRYGPYGVAEGFANGKNFERPVYPFQGRLTSDGSSGYQADPGRYHLYISPECPWSQRTAIVRKLKGLEEVVTLSLVDDDRDSRGWAFRARRGADPVNGFRFLREAYEATAPGYRGHISVPVLWDRRTSRIVSNNFADITLDLNCAFPGYARTEVDLYPKARRAEIDRLNAMIYERVNNGVYLVAGALSEDQYTRLRCRVVGALEVLDRRLQNSRYLLGDVITEADVRLWVSVARYDVSYNPRFGISRRSIGDFEHLWAWARDLYSQPAFYETTFFDIRKPWVEVPKQVAFLNEAQWRIHAPRVSPDWPAVPTGS